MQNIKSWAPNLDAETLKQIQNVASLPIIFKHVAVMPDAHLGKGSTIGTVIATKGAIIPAAVGVDIGCGMSALQLPFRIEALKDLKKLRHSIERSIPTGRQGHQELSQRRLETFQKLGMPTLFTPNDKTFQKALDQLGSLGSGNHFIEVCYDQNHQAWLLLHSGSRNIGKVLAEHHIQEAKGLFRERLDKTLPDADLAYLTENTAEFQDYVHDLLWAQNYAKQNRLEMVQLALREISMHLYRDERLLEVADTFFHITCHHNYAQQESHFGQKIWITRKGAVSAQKDQWGIIPGSMGAESFIVKGKGSIESFCSCSHGAGRQMSRGEAKRRFTLDELKQQTYAIESRKDVGILDEIPEAYKDIHEVMSNQSDLVDPIFTLKQVLCIKGD